MLVLPSGALYLSHYENLDPHGEFSRSAYLPSGVSVASEARPIIAFYLRFGDICIYIYILGVRDLIDYGD